MCFGNAKQKFLRIGSWNINGINYNINEDKICKINEDTLKLVNNNDITVLMETHLNNNEIIDIENFSCTSISRPVCRSGWYCCIY